MFGIANDARYVSWLMAINYPHRWHWRQSIVNWSAAVALMGQARGIYTFNSHLKWTPVILLGYFAGVVTHLYLNTGYFN